MKYGTVKIFSKRVDNSKTRQNKVKVLGTAHRLKALIFCVQFKQIISKGFRS
jgi:uncharacterized lipoprotein YajG